MHIFLDPEVAKQVGCKVEPTAHMCDMVLGGDWLKKCGDVLMNLSKLQLSFKRNGKKITLTGGKEEATLKMMSGHALKRFLRKNTHGLMATHFPKKFVFNLPTHSEHDMNSPVSPLYTTPILETPGLPLDVASQFALTQPGGGNDRFNSLMTERQQWRLPHRIQYCTVG
ncbi:hypothetical protein IFM89_038419 [Coptis chinensis]|uniref:Uncharacterized protein n=1 Tax=Coptis chinensis TaxID=261450 RepID=A0A835LKV3_9MAGN|nr:hypothetical protein IFM89_038419 [Coptis chinensis]